MNNLERKVLVLHHVDRDGYISAAIVRKLLDTCNCNYTIEYKAVDYSDPLDSMGIIEATYSDIYLVDYNISTDSNAQCIINWSKHTNVTWIDHHKDSIEMEDKYPELKTIKGIRVIGMAGAGLSYIYCESLTPIHNDNIKNAMTVLTESKKDDSTISLDDARNLLIQCHAPKLILYTHRWDIWDHSKEDQTPVYFNYGYPCPATVIDAYCDLCIKCDKDCDDFIIKGKIAYEEICKRNASMLDKIGFDFVVYDEENDIKYTAKAINRPFGDSLMFGEQLGKDFDIGCIFFYNGKTQKWTYSFYSDNYGKIDVGVLCKRLGGGGHMHAAGFSNSFPLLSPDNTFSIGSTNIMDNLCSHVDAQFQSSYAKNELQRLLGELKENILVEEDLSKRGFPYEAHIC